jgi:hypothetical protein
MVPHLYVVVKLAEPEPRHVETQHGLVRMCGSHFTFLKLTTNTYNTDPFKLSYFFIEKGHLTRPSLEAIVGTKD